MGYRFNQEHDIHGTKSVRMFESDWMERLSHVHPITPAIVWGPILSYTYWWSFSSAGLSPRLVLAMTLAGLFFWTFAEYMLHRYAFHYPAKSKLGKRFVFIMHGNHHEVPNDPTRLVMPPVASLSIASLFLVSFLAVFGMARGLPFFSGFITGYLFYDYTHYSSHHFMPNSTIGKFLKQSHMVHHYTHPDKRWGVSSPLWDLVFGTFK